MPYIARAAVELRDDYPDSGIDEWHYIKCIESIEYRWRLNKDRTYEVIGGLFDSRNEALKCAKKMYVTLLYSMLKGGIAVSEFGCEIYPPQLYVEALDGDEEAFSRNEEYFFWTKKRRGRSIGPGVFEVDNSFEELSEYRAMTMTISMSHLGSDLHFDNVDEYVFSYSREAQQLLKSVVSAEQADNSGLMMTIYCGFLEHLSPEMKKAAEVQNVIDELIMSVSASGLSKDQKEQLMNLLRSGKNVSAGQKCKLLCEQYASKQYGKYSLNQIINAAYRIRSSYAHGDECIVQNGDPAWYIKYVVLDVIKKYMREKEREANV